MTGQRVWAGDNATFRGGAIVRAVHTWVTPHPVALLTGNAGSDETRVLAAGSEPWASFIAEHAFDEAPRRRAMANRPVWSLPRLFDSLPAEVDLVTVRVDRLTARWLFRQPHLTVPEWVNMTTTLPPDLGQWRRGRHGKSLDKDLRWVNQSNLVVEVSQQEEDLAEFYQRYYLPHVSARFGARAYARPFAELRHLQQRGGLVWVRREGQRIHGGVYFEQDGTLYNVVAAPLRGDRNWMEQGAHTAALWHLMEHAQRSGCKRVSLGATRPILTDGALRYKRKFHAAFMHDPQLWYDFVVAWQALTPGVTTLLTRSPLVYRLGAGFAAAGCLAGEAGTQAEGIRHLSRYLWTEGLQRLFLVSPEGWSPEVTAPQRVTLLSPETACRADPAAWAAEGERAGALAGSVGSVVNRSRPGSKER